MPHRSARLTSGEHPAARSERMRRGFRATFAKIALGFLFAVVLLTIAPALQAATPQIASCSRAVKT
jgi:tetrahydromethanopterin S-methyltransferase subunit F